MTVTQEEYLRRLRKISSSGLGVPCPVCEVGPTQRCVSYVSSEWVISHTRKRDNPHPERVGAQKTYDDAFNAGMAEMAQIVVAAIQRQKED